MANYILMLVFTRLCHEIFILFLQSGKVDAVFDLATDRAFVF